MLATAFHLVSMRRNSGSIPSLPHTLSWQLYGQHIPCLLWAYIEPTLLASLLYYTMEISSQFFAGLLTCLNSRLQDWSSCTTQGTIVRTDELTNSQQPTHFAHHFDYKYRENRAVFGIWIQNHTFLLTVVFNITVLWDVTPCGLVGRHEYV